MIIFSIFATLMLLAPMLGIGPPVNWRGAAVRNRIFSISMLPRGHQKYGSIASPRFVPIYAQELVEWWIAWAVALVALTPVAAGLSLVHPLAPLVAIVAAPLAWNWRVTDWGRKQLEYVGHAAEWLVAERAGIMGYTQFEVAQRLQGGYLVFQGMTIEEVGTALRKRRPVARVLITLLALNIRRASR